METTAISIKDIPIALRDEIKALADKERRSMAQQIIIAIEEHVAKNK
jgi:hypothetical protein